MIGRPAAPIFEEDLDAKILFSDPHFVVAGLQNRWTGRRKIKLAELIDEPWCLPVDSIPRSAIIANFRAAGVGAPRAAVSAAPIQLHTYLLATGRFLSILPKSIIHFSGKNSAFKVLPVDLPVQLNPVFIVTLKNRTPNPAAQLVIDCAHEVARPLVKQK
jgi:DNA-binding transcriptional LysR family regulator